MTDRRAREAAASLRDVVELENAALRDSDFPRAAGYLATKRACVEAFSALGRMQEPGAGDRAAPGAIDASFAASIRQLDAALDENRVLLERAMQVQSRVLALLAGAARQDADPAAQYGRSGSYHSFVSRDARAVSREL